MDRFSAYLLVRRHIKRPENRNQALVAEAIMEELAARLGQPQGVWGVMGLLSQLDLEYTAQNPAARGRTARQQAELEGLAPEKSAPLEGWCRHLAPPSFEGLEELAPPEPTLLEAGLLVSTSVAENILGRTPERRAAVESLAHDLRLTSEQGDALGDALDRALSRLALDPQTVAELSVAALQRIEQDLR
jgi:hypothetical protein